LISDLASHIDQFPNPVRLKTAASLCCCKMHSWAPPHDWITSSLVGYTSAKYASYCGHRLPSPAYQALPVVNVLLLFCSAPSKENLGSRFLLAPAPRCCYGISLYTILHTLHRFFSLFCSGQFYYYYSILSVVSSLHRS
jgi:hypothetical protein